MCAETDLEAEVDPSVETEEKLRAKEEAAQQRLQAMQRCAGWFWRDGSLPTLICMCHALLSLLVLHIVRSFEDEGTCLWRIVCGMVKGYRVS